MKEIKGGIKMSYRKKMVQALGFEDVEHFNRVLDTDKNLQDGLADLAVQFPHLTEEDYTARLIQLLHDAGLDITVGEFKTLLALRRQLDQQLLYEKDNSYHQNKLSKKYPFKRGER